MNERSSHKSVPAAPPGSSFAARAGSGSSQARALGGQSDGEQTVISNRPPMPNLDFAAGAPPLESGSLLEGERLGQFVLEKFVGGGGMGIVFRALDTTLNREVAVKVLSRDQSADEETLRRFRNEAQSAARLNHDNIARVHYVGEDRGVHYIVFEFIEGVNIRDLVEQNGPLPLNEALSYTYQIAQALEHASQRAVIHRDIKPSNVLVTPDGKAKLVDMGLARLNQVAHHDDLTASGVTLGTFDYISPEQARDPRSADVRSDLYSLGCSFYFMLTGRPPFPDGTVLQKLLQHQADSPPDPRGLRPDLPSEVARVVSRLLAKNPAQRYQRPSDLIDDLVPLGEALGMPFNSARAVWMPPRGERPLARWQHHLPWMAPLAALFLIVLALDYYWAVPASELVGPVMATPARVAPVEVPRPEPAMPEVSEEPPAASDDLELSLPEQPVEVPSAENTGPPPAAAPAGVKRPSNPLAESLLREGIGKIGETLRFDRWMPRVPAGSAKTEPPAAADSPATTAPTPPEAKAAAREAEIPGQRILIVGDGAGALNYASLHSACSDAKNGDVIELRYDGRRLEKPITLSNTKVTIRAGQQYRPIVVFRPDPIVDPAIYPSGMVTIAGGQFKAIDLHWELDLPRNVSADWTLFETRRAELVQFQRCLFTVRNASPNYSAYHPGVSFFDIKAPPGGVTMAMDNSEAEHVVGVELENCVARGEATFLRDNDLQPVRLQWTNGLLSTSERMLVAAGGPTQPRQLGHIQLDLRHVTAYVQNGLALLTNTQDAPYQLFVDFDCADCVFAAAGKAALIEQRGSDRMDDYLNRVRWRGQRDDFTGFAVFWQISSTTHDTATRQMDFAAWQQFWQGQSRLQRNGVLTWERPPKPDQATHAQVPADFVVAASSDELQAGTVAGLIVKDLPRMARDETDATLLNPLGGAPAQSSNPP